MATKAKSTPSFPAFTQVQDSLRALQKEGEKLLTRVRKDVGGLISKDQRKAIENLVSQATRLRRDLQKRAEKAVKDLETRAEKLLKRIETRAEQGIEPVIRRLSVPSKADVAALEKRLATLEKRVEEITRNHAA